MVLTVFLAILMVSNIRYHSFKEVDMKNKVPFMYVPAVIIIFAFFSLDPPKLLFLAFLLYMFSGIVMTLWRVRKHQYERKKHVLKE